MADYKAMYLKLFNEVSDVITTLQNIQTRSLKKTGENRTTIEVCELSPIIETLQNIQIKTEDMYLDK